MSYRFNIKYDNGYLFKINKRFLDENATEEFDKQKSVELNVLEFNHPSITHQRINKKFQNVDLNFPSVKPVYSEFSAKLLLDSELKIYKFFTNWMKYFGDRTNINSYTLVPNKDFNEYTYSLGQLYLTNNNLTYSNLRFEYLNLFPVGISNFTLTTTNADIIPLTITVNFLIDDFKLI